ncbi:MAG: type II toxin-antitoxin system VapC family toxin [Kiritimatiellae bacterium]|nr:type II toxin-antitoxin system VapC family toxin [Kiritimatiellia bacterium]
MGLVLDTSALIQIERTDGILGDALAAYEKETVVIPAIVWAELLMGVRMAKGAKTAARRRAKLEQIRLYIPVIDFDAAIAEHYADIFRESSRKGAMLPQNDLATAATARALGYRLLVGAKDEKHFRLVQGLKLVVLGVE